jgi:saccharopine dehydrogenase-like NADP-dependent oxidoreductase
VLGEKARVATGADGFAAAVRGVDAVVDAASHRLNMDVMRACLDEGAHYTDLGGLFHVALEQFSLDDAFAERGLAAAISMGSAPGVTNMLAAAAAERLDTVESIEIADAIIPGRDPDPRAPYVPPDAASTIVDEFTARAAVFLDGELRMVPGDTSSKVYSFAEADVECVYTIHSEPATLPHSYATRGVRCLRAGSLEAPRSGGGQETEPERKRRLRMARHGLARAGAPAASHRPEDLPMLGLGELQHRPRRRKVS